MRYPYAIIVDDHDLQNAATDEKSLFTNMPGLKQVFTFFKCLRLKSVGDDRLIAFGNIYKELQKGNQLILHPFKS